MEQIDSLVLQGQERFTRYQTYEELRAHWWRLSREYPEIAHLEQWGRGADRDEQYPNGRPIEALILSNPKEAAKRPFALLQMEHENELPTTLAIQLIADIVCQNPEILDELGYNLILLNTTHPDGIALQEWIHAGEFTPLSYPLGFYRSAADEQVAWGYPFRHKKASRWRVSPENRASMGLIEYHAPTYLHSFHAAGIDDAYVFIEDPGNGALARSLIGAFQSRGLHMQQGAPEFPHYKKVDGYDGVYSPLPRAGLEYEAFYGDTELAEEIEWEYGTMASDFVTGIADGVQAVLTEVPFLTAAALRNQSPADLLHADAQQIDRKYKLRNLESIEACMPVLGRAMRSEESPQAGRLLRSLTWYHGLLQRTIARPLIKVSRTEQKITIAEAFGMTERLRYYDLLFRGEVHHLANRLGEKAMADDIKGQLEAEIGEINQVSELQTLPLPKLVGAQALGALVALAA